MAGADSAGIWERLSFLAAPDRISDWRKVLLFDVAAETGILSALPGRTEELSAHLSLDARAVRIVLEALEPWGLVVAASGQWSLGPEAPDAEETAVLRHHAGAMRMWAGRIEDRVRGVEAPDAIERPRRLDQWMEALAANARASAPAAVDACLAALPRASSVLDLGGGHGEYALEFARRGLEATVQDRPEVIELARREGRLDRAGVHLFTGDFFEALADGAFDIVFCAGVTYTYDGERNLELYQRVKGLLAPAGMLVIHTFLRERRPLASLFAVQMLAVGRGGDTHAEQEQRRWLLQAGYHRVEVVELAREPESLLLATPGDADWPIVASERDLPAASVRRS